MKMAQLPKCKKAKKGESGFSNSGEKDRDREIKATKAKMIFYEFSFNGRIPNIFKKRAILMSKMLGIFFPANSALPVQLGQTRRRNEPKRRVTSDDSSPALLVLREREGMLQQGIIYCEPGQRGLSREVSTKAKQARKAEKRKKREKARNLSAQ